MSATAYHMVHYREFKPTGLPGDASLEGLVRQSLSGTGPSGLPRWEAINDRLMPLETDVEFELVLNRVADLSSAVFGEMCLVHSKGLQALLQMKAKKHQLSTLTLAEIYELLESGAPEGTKYIRGLSYFLVIGNHFFFIRTQSLNEAHVQTYIDWLLRTDPKVVPQGATTLLEARIDPSISAKDIGEIKALRVSGPNFPQMSVAPASPAQEKERTTTRKVADKFVQFEKAFAVAKTILGETEAIALAESLGPQERLVVDAQFKVKGKRTEQSRAKLKELAKSLDTMTEGKITVEGRNGKLIDKNLVLRTNMPFSVDQHGSVLLDFDNVADQLQKVYGRFVEDELIEA